MSKAHQQLSAAEIEALGYDRTEVETIPVVVVALAIIGFIIASMVGCAIYYYNYRDAQVEALQNTPVSAELLKLRAREDQHLNTYGTIDKPAGVVRLPIDKAMELIVTEAAPGGAWKFPTNTYAVKKPEDAAALAAAEAAVPLKP